MPPDPVADTLFGKLRREILALCFSTPDASYYVREIARITGASPGAVQRELGELTSVGLLNRSRRGRQVFYQANRASPVFPDLQSMLAKTVGVVDVLRSALAPLADRIDGAVIFGSVASGIAAPASDIDVLVVGEAELSEISDALATVEDRLGREIVPAVYSAPEYRRRLAERGHFLSSVRRAPTVPIMGALPDGS